MSKLLLVVGLAILSASLYYLRGSQGQMRLDSSIPLEVVQNFSSWKVQYGKKYSTQENSYRLQVYYENTLIIASHNSDPTQTYTLGENQFTDLTKEEFIATYLIQEPETDPQPQEEISPSIQTADSRRRIQENNQVDWSSQVVVKNQGGCGSCWAFGTTGVVEAYYKIILGKVVSLSEQQLVDCSKDNNGCNGGLAPLALDYITANGITTEAAYPYKAVNGPCKALTGPIYKINGKVAIQGTTEGVQAALLKYPVSISVDASNWSQYKSGIFSNCGLNTNHAVLAVGFDSSNNWKVKNSWGTSWGENGFIRLAPGNTCNIFKRPHQAT